MPKHPEKYLGNPENIMARSSWEVAFYKWLDLTPAILRWGSEEITIPYISPLDMKAHRYFPDAFIIYKDKTGNIKKELIEIKPYKETVVTPKTSDRDKAVIAVNHAKWEAAQRFCALNGMTFRVVTERTLFYNNTPKKPLRSTKPKMPRQAKSRRAP